MSKDSRYLNLLAVVKFYISTVYTDEETSRLAKIPLMCSFGIVIMPVTTKIKKF